MVRIGEVTKNLLILNIIFFIGTSLLADRVDLVNLLSLHYPTEPSFGVWQFVSYMFMHGGISHLFFNMLGIWMFGTSLEDLWGPKKFLTFYIISGLGAALFHLLILTFTGVYSTTMLGASGALFGILAGYGFTFPEQEMINIMFPVPIKAKYYVIIYGVLEIFFGIRGTDNIAHFAHLGGMIAGVIMLLIWRQQRR